MLKKYLLLSIILIFISVSFSQGTVVYSPNQYNGITPFPGEPCASDYLEKELLKDSSYARTRANMEIYIQQQTSSRSGGRGVVYTIPVVFHVMHSGEAVGDSTNISLAQIQSAIAGLNRDFRRTNADGGIAQSGPLGVDAEIEFCLAQRDPSGNATDGVTRHDMSGIQGYLDSGVYHTASLWRHDANMKTMVQWNPAQYLNIWVVNKIRSTTNIYAGGGGGVVGYATFPGGTPGRDGVVIRFSATGSDPSGTSGYNLWFATDDGRVLTHEVGHYLALYHTFQSTTACGTSGASCATIGDRCCDTPPTIVGSGNNCTTPVCPLENKENYMQYQNGSCASDFTPDQVARMRAVLASTASWGRNPLVNTLNCVAPPMFDLELDTIFAPQDTICNNLFTPEIVVCNNSSDTVTSFDVFYGVDTNSKSSYTWSGILLSGECDTFSLPSVITTGGSHKFHVIIDSLNINISDSDIDPSNNIDSTSFYSDTSNLIVIDTTLCPGDSIVLLSGTAVTTTGTYFDTIGGSSGTSAVTNTLYSEDFEGTSHSFTLNTNDVSSIIPGANDNAWIVNNSYTGGSFTFMSIPVPIGNTPNQNATITGNVNSNYLHIHSRYAASNSTPSVTNCNYLDGTGSFVGATSGMNFSKMTSDISTLGRTNVSFNMYYLCAGSWGRVYYSTNGGTTWTRIGGNLISATWTNFTISNPAFDNQVTLRFAVAFNNTDGVAVDPAYGVDEIAIRSIDSLSSGGCDSIIQYNVNVLPVNDTTIFDTICSGQTYTRPGGGTATTAGTYRDTLTSAVSCDSIIITNLALTSSSTISQTISSCDSFVSATMQVYTTSGTYNDTLVTSAGCDSIVITNLTINNSSSSVQTFSSCDTVISPSGKIWTSSGTYFDTINNSAGCDSLMTFNLTIDTVVINNQTPITACDSAQVNGIWYYSSQIISDTITGGASTGCDSIVNTNLTIDTSTWSIITTSVCDSLVTGSGKVFKNSGYFRDTMPNSVGCDSLVEYYLTVNYTTYSNIVTSACDTFISPSGKIFTTTGSYQDTLLKSSGCDSIISIYLVMDTPSFVTLDTTICHDDSIVLSNGTVLNTSGTYFDTVVGTNSSFLIFSEDFEGSTHSFTLNTNDTNAITPGGVDNAWIVNNSYAGGNVFGTPVPPTPNQNATVTGSTTSNYMHIHNRYTATWSLPSITNSNYIDGNITLLGGQNGLNFTKMTSDISTAGMNYVSFEMYYLCRGSWGRLYYSTNSGATWTRVGGNFNNTGTQWSTVTIVDPAFANQPTIRFAFGFNNTDGGVGSSPGFAVDEIAVRGVSADSTICDSITQINLTVVPVYRDTATATVCDSTVWRGMTLTTSGTYSDTVFMGCDSIFILNLQVDTTKRTTIDTTLCPGDSIVLLSGTAVKLPGTYFVTLNVLPCDSIIQYNVTVLPVNDTTIFDTICGNDPYTLPNGGTHSGTGIYRDTLVSSAGCDSIIVINLQVYDTSSSSFSLTGCDSVVSPSGKIWRTNGVYADTILNAAGCDSLMSISVTISSIYRDTITDTVCDSTTWRGMVYTSTGVYSDTVMGTGCDSIFSIDLLVNTSSFSSTMVSACDSFMLPSGTTVYTSGTYNDTLVSSGGCDSIVSTTVTIGTASSSTINPTACASYTSPSGKVWTTTGTYNDTIPNAAGCDSVITINLTITPSTTITVLANGCDTYTLPGGGTATTTGTYRDTLVASNGCDSIVVTNLILGQSSNTTNTYSLCAGETVTVGGNTYGATGIYRDTFITAFGCDSIIVTNLTINSLVPASITYTIDLCEDASPVTFTATPFGGTWGGTGIDTSTGLFDPSVAGAGIYTITYTAPGPCGATDTATVRVFSSPTIVATVLDDACDFGRGSIDVTIAGGTAPITYTWSNGETTEDLIGLKQGSYTLSVVDANGCSDSKTEVVTNLNSDTCDYNIFVPNIFSPNGDGENDVLQVEGAGIATLEFVIYNRWGNLIFESSSQADGWDGTFQGKPANPDVFVYYVKATFVDGKSFNQKGTVALIKR